MEILKCVNMSQYICFLCANTSSMCISTTMHLLLGSITPFYSNSYLILFIFSFFIRSTSCPFMYMCFPFNPLIVFIRYCFFVYCIYFYLFDLYSSLHPLTSFPKFITSFSMSTSHCVFATFYCLPIHAIMCEKSIFRLKIAILVQPNLNL